VTARPEHVDPDVLKSEVYSRIRKRYPLLADSIIGVVVWETLQVLSNWNFVELEIVQAVRDGD